jgi:hypothetical protein
MCVEPISGVGAGCSGISPLLIEQYKKLNREIKKKRLSVSDDIEAISKVSTQNIEFPPEELRETNAIPLFPNIPIKFAYTVIHRLCGNFFDESLENEIKKFYASRIYNTL